MTKGKRIAAATAIVTAGLGLAGMGAASTAEAQPGPFPNWCPGEWWDPGWGNNWDWGSCHEQVMPNGGPGPGPYTPGGMPNGGPGPGPYTPGGPGGGGNHGFGGHGGH